MFKKKPNIKTLSQLRSSDRRKIADRIISDFNLLPENTQGSKNDSTDDKSTIKEVRDSVIPDNVLTAKFHTTHGPNLKEVTGTVYVGSHGSGDQRILWISLYDRLYPTVYTLWKNPGLIPLLHTPPIVVEKIKGGADLMTPGLAGPPFPERAKKDSIVAIAGLDSPTVPVVIGTCEFDISTLQKAQGVKGKAVEVFHWAGDEIWDWSASGKAGSPPPGSIEGWIEDQSDGGIAQQTNGLSLEDGNTDGGVSLEEEQEDSTSKAYIDRRNGYVEGEDAIAELVDSEPEKAMTTKEIDDAFRNALLFGVYQQKRSNPNAPKYGLTFPLSQSFVMSNLVLPFLPAFTPTQAQSLVIKKSSWKTNRKFLKSLDKEKLLIGKDRGGQEFDIWDIDFNDRAFTEFQPYSIPKKETRGDETPNSNSKGSASGGDDSIGQHLKRIDLYKPKDSLSKMFGSSNSSKKDLYTATDLRPIITSYIEKENLINTTNKRLINLDPYLSNALFDPSQNKLDAEILAKGSLPRDALIDRVIHQHCHPYHVILRDDESLGDSKVKPKPGPSPKIGIILETRSGNKTMTRVFALEAYYINPQTLAEELRKSCASSTTVEPYKAGGKGMMEVDVQGPQKDAVVKALEKRGVNKNWVEITDKTKGKKK